MTPKFRNSWHNPRNRTVLAIYVKSIIYQLNVVSILVGSYGSGYKSSCTLFVPPLSFSVLQSDRVSFGHRFEDASPRAETNKEENELPVLIPTKKKHPFSLMQKRARDFTICAECTKPRAIYCQFASNLMLQYIDHIDNSKIYKVLFSLRTRLDVTSIRTWLVIFRLNKASTRLHLEVGSAITVRAKHSRSDWGKIKTAFIFYSETQLFLEMWSYDHQVTT